MLKEIMVMFFVSIALFGLIMSIKVKITYDSHVRVDDAIYLYQLECVQNGKAPLVDYGDAEPFERTLWRLYDWGHKRILPKEKYEMIKPYILERR